MLNCSCRVGERDLFGAFYLALFASVTKLFRCRATWWSSTELARTMSIFQKVILRDCLLCSDRAEKFYASFSHQVAPNQWESQKKIGIFFKVHSNVQGRATARKKRLEKETVLGYLSFEIIKQKGMLS